MRFLEKYIYTVKVKKPFEDPSYGMVYHHVHECILEIMKKNKENNNFRSSYSYILSYQNQEFNSNLTIICWCEYCWTFWGLSHIVYSYLDSRNTLTIYRKKLSYSLVVKVWVNCYLFFYLVTVTYVKSITGAPKSSARNSIMR